MKKVKLVSIILGLATLVFAETAFSTDPDPVRSGAVVVSSDCLYSPVFPTANCAQSGVRVQMGQGSSVPSGPLVSNPFSSFVPAAKSPFQNVDNRSNSSYQQPLQNNSNGTSDIMSAFGAKRNPPAVSSGTPSAGVSQNPGGTSDIMGAFGARKPPEQTSSGATSYVPAVSGQPLSPTGTSDIMGAFGVKKPQPPVQTQGTANSNGVRAPDENTTSDIMGAFRKPKPVLNVAPQVVQPNANEPGLKFERPELNGKPGNPVAAELERPAPQPVPAAQTAVPQPGAQPNNAAANSAAADPLPDSKPVNDGQSVPLTPVLPTERNRKTLESLCPDCVDPNYSAKFKGLQDIRDRMPGVDSILRTAAHNMMKIIHMRCDANDVFVPGDYVTNLVYCGGVSCDRMGSKATDTYFPDQIEKFKADQVNGDIYRVPLPPGVANIRVSDSKNDTRTCKDLHDRPFMFHIGGRATFSGGAMDPFDYQAHRSLTDGKLNLIDCASTIDAVFAAAGLKFSTKDTNMTSAYGKSTSALVALANAGARDKTSCIAIPEFKGDDSIRSGDVFVIHRNANGKRQDMGHAMMFDDVKEDPFNLAGITNPEDCRTKIEPSKFRFSILQSSGTTVDRQVFEKFKGIDLTIEQHFDKFNAVHPEPCANYSDPGSCDFRARFEDWGAHILQMAKKACLAKTSPQKSFKAGEPLLSRDTARVGTKEVPVSVTGVLFRHKGASDGCSVTPPEIVGSRCVAGCLEK